MANSRSEMHADKSGLGSSLDQFLQPYMWLAELCRLVVWASVPELGVRSPFQQEGTFESGVEV